MINKIMTQIKIGARTYSISKENLDKIGHETDGEVQGYVDYFQSRIIINENLSLDAEEEVLVHELLHTIIDRKNIEILARKSTPEEFVENMVEYLTPRLHSFLKDNPEFISEFVKKTNK